MIAAFIVGMGVSSRGEALIKALQRVAGTLFGIAVGIGMATLLSGHVVWSLALVLVCVFFAFYAFQAAYGIMSFWITVMLALLYGLLGQFQPQLMLLRLEETAAGASVAVLVTMILLPIRESEVFLKAARDFLDSLAKLMRLAGQPQTGDVAGAASELRAKGQTLRNAVGTVKRGWVPLVPDSYRRSVRMAMRCAYLAREAAQAGALSREETGAIIRRIGKLRAGLDHPDHWLQGRTDAPVLPRSGGQPLYEAMINALDLLARSLLATR